MKNGHLENREGNESITLRWIQADRLRGREVDGSGSLQHPMAIKHQVLSHTHTHAHIN
jgi:hypothetical protein